MYEVGYVIWNHYRKQFSAFMEVMQVVKSGLATGLPSWRYEDRRSSGFQFRVPKSLRFRWTSDNRLVKPSFLGVRPAKIERTVAARSTFEPRKDMIDAPYSSSLHLSTDTDRTLAQYVIT